MMGPRFESELAVVMILEFKPCQHMVRHNEETKAKGTRTLDLDSFV